MARPSFRRSADVRVYATVVAAIVIVCTLLVGFDGWRTWQARSVQIAENKVETANLARSLAQHAHDTMQAADTVLVGLRQSVATSGLTPEKLVALRDYMAVSIATLSSIQGLFVYDANGHWIVSSTPSVSGMLANSDNAYFQYHRSNPDLGVHIGQPLQSSPDGNWIITASRRINAPDGNFAGLVMATISIEAIQKFYGSFDIGPHGAITLFSADGALIARHPATESLLDTDLSRRQLFKAVAQRSSGVGSLQYGPSLDGVTRFGSYRRVEGFSLIVVVSYGLEDALAGWRADAGYHFAVVLGVVAVLVFFGHRFAQQARQRQHMEWRYRFLAEHSSDAIVCMALSGECLYLSPAFSQMTGWNEQEIEGNEWGYFIHPDDRKVIMDIGQQLSNGIGQAVAVYRYLCKDGSQLWVEASFVLLPAADGEPAQFVANIRDITARKFTESRLAAASQEFARQASSDDLTGVANQRRFDEVLGVEWGRAARDLRPVSLLMIDVDVFKAYNDRNSHQQGDHVLQVVATAISQSMRRPGDLVARYGGEGFAVLLPETDASGASEVADKVQVAIERLGIEHAGNLSLGRLRASIGIATTYPEHQGAKVLQEALIAAADAALYAAKRTERDQLLTVMQPTPLSQETVNGVLSS